LRKTKAAAVVGIQAQERVVALAESIKADARIVVR
jgi:head-tail adaptor